MGMEAVIGHENVKRFLESSVNGGRIGHAYIFEGASGIGRLSLAKAFAEKIVGCADADSSPDIIVVTNSLYDSSKKQANVLVDTIRKMKADVYIRPYRSDRKVYIVPNADSMQDAAQNSLLKVFEEPPEYCTIILIVQNSNSMLQTIRSRAVLVRLHPLPVKSVEQYLTKVKGLSAENAAALAVMSGGSIGRALTLSEDSDAAGLRGEVIDHLVSIIGSGARPLYDFIKFLKQNKTSIGLIIEVMSGWSSDVLHIKTGGDVSGDILNTDKAAELEKFCRAVTREAALRFEEIVTKYSLAIGRNANYPIAVQCMATEYWEEIHGRNYRSAF